MKVHTMSRGWKAGPFLTSACTSLVLLLSTCNASASAWERGLGDTAPSLSTGAREREISWVAREKRETRVERKERAASICEESEAMILYVPNATEDGYLARMLGGDEEGNLRDSIMLFI